MKTKKCIKIERKQLNFSIFLDSFILFLREISIFFKFNNIIKENN